MTYPFLGKMGQRSANFLGLTLAGALKIACYDEETHNYAFHQCAGSTKIKNGEIADTIKYYSTVCNDYCRSHFIDPDYGIFNKLMMQHKISYDDELYLPENERVQVAMPIEDLFSKRKSSQQHPGSQGPRKPLASTLHTAKYLFPFSPSDRSKMDDIAEAIKLVGYIAAGIHGPIWSAPEALAAFMEKAQLKITDMISKGEKYNLDLAGIISAMDTFIDWTLERHHDLKHIQAVTSSEDAKQRAHQAIAEFIPKILKPFSQVRA